MVIENELAKGCNQTQIAQTYALALRSSYPTDWAKVNRMIIDRWSVSGLQRIKKWAHSGKCLSVGGTESNRSKSQLIVKRSVDLRSKEFPKTSTAGSLRNG